MKITDDMLTEWRKQFEVEFPMPPDCVWTGKGYVATSYNAWETHTFIARWEGWQAARRTTSDREAIIEECAKVCDASAGRRWYAEDKASEGCEFCAEEIRALKTAPTTPQPFSLTEDDPQEGVAFQYANELVAKRLRGDKGGA